MFMVRPADCWASGNVDRVYIYIYIYMYIYICVLVTILTHSIMIISISVIITCISTLKQTTVK